MALVGRRGVVWTLVALLVLPAAQAAEPPPPTEYEVKAAFLYHFAKYSEWPSEAEKGGDLFVVGVLGRDPFGSVLDETLAGKEVRGRKLAVRRCSTVEEARQVRILFVNPEAKAELGRVLQSLAAHPVLTVGDLDQFASKGGMIGFRVQGEIVRFDINVEQVEKAGLRMSSQVLKLARIVRGAPQG
jgi:hypothetical protein